MLDMLGQPQPDGDAAAVDAANRDIKHQAKQAAAAAAASAAAAAKAASQRIVPGTPLTSPTSSQPTAEPSPLANLQCLPAQSLRRNSPSTQPLWPRAEQLLKVQAHEGQQGEAHESPHDKQLLHASGDATSITQPMHQHEQPHEQQQQQQTYITSSRNQEQHRNLLPPLQLDAPPICSTSTSHPFSGHPTPHGTRLDLAAMQAQLAQGKPLSPSDMQALVTQLAVSHTPRPPVFPPALAALAEQLTSKQGSITGGSAQNGSKPFHPQLQLPPTLVIPPPPVHDLILSPKLSISPLHTKFQPQPLTLPGVLDLMSPSPRIPLSTSANKATSLTQFNSLNLNICKSPLNPPAAQPMPTLHLASPSCSAPAAPSAFKSVTPCATATTSPAGHQQQAKPSTSPSAQIAPVGTSPPAVVLQQSQHVQPLQPTTSDMQALLQAHLGASGNSHLQGFDLDALLAQLTEQQTVGPGMDLQSLQEQLATQQPTDLHSALQAQLAAQAKAQEALAAQATAPGSGTQLASTSSEASKVTIGGVSSSGPSEAVPVDDGTACPRLSLGGTGVQPQYRSGEDALPISSRSAAALPLQPPLGVILLPGASMPLQLGCQPIVLPSMAPAAGGPGLGSLAAFFSHSTVAALEATSAAANVVGAPSSDEQMVQSIAAQLHLQQQLQLQLQQQSQADLAALVASVSNTDADNSESSAAIQLLLQQVLLLQQDAVLAGGGPGGLFDPHGGFAHLLAGAGFDNSGDFASGLLSALTGSYEDSNNNGLHTLGSKRQGDYMAHGSSGQLHASKLQRTAGDMSSGSGGGRSMRDGQANIPNYPHLKGMCHVDGCTVDLSTLTGYYQRYRTCEAHLKASCIMKDGVQQRFCQQCGRFHHLTEFDGQKRSCRQRLSSHNSRRRKKGGDDLHMPPAPHHTPVSQQPRAPAQPVPAATARLPSPRSQALALLRHHQEQQQQPQPAQVARPQSLMDSLAAAAALLPSLPAAVLPMPGQAGQPGTVATTSAILQQLLSQQAHMLAKEKVTASATDSTVLKPTSSVFAAGLDLLASTLTSVSKPTPIKSPRSAKAASAFSLASSALLLHKQQHVTAQQ